MGDASFRAFSKELEELADAWSKTAVTNENWTDLGPFGGTESSPFKVQLANTNLQGVAKPGVKKNDGYARAAHEKIASDLAFGLKLPVPPVILWDRGEKAPSERYLGISAWAFPQPMTWDQSSNGLNQQQKTEASRVVSAMLAFEAWISATDRKSDHLLLYLPSADQPVQLAFIDYAFSLSYTWKSKDDPVGASAQYVPLPQDIDSLRTMADRILHFDEKEVKSIVGRIPREYLSEQQQDVILSNLLSRKQKLLSLLSLK